MKLHAVNLLAFWLWLLCGLPWLERHSLLVLSSLVLLGAVLLARIRLLKSLPRMRWLLLAVVGIYAWSTPGLYLFPYWFSPTVNGLMAGFEQALRLLVVAASLQIMLTYLNKSDIVSGLYYLMLPLHVLGLDSGRLALRLTLTLNDAEQLLAQKQTFSELMQALMNPQQQDNNNEFISIERLRIGQGIFLLLQVLLIGLTVWIGNFLLWN